MVSTPANYIESYYIYIVVIIVGPVKLLKSTQTYLNYKDFDVDKPVNEKDELYTSIHRMFPDV